MLSTGCCYQHLHPGEKYLPREGNATGRAMLTKSAGTSLLRAGLMWHAFWMPTVCCPVCLAWVRRFLALLILALSIPFHSCYSCDDSSAGVLAWVRGISQQGCTLCNVVKCVLIHHPLHYFSSLWDLVYIITLLKRKTRKRKCISYLFTSPSDFVWLKKLESFDLEYRIIWSSSHQHLMIRVLELRQWLYYKFNKVPSTAELKYFTMPEIANFDMDIAKMWPKGKQ